MNSITFATLAIVAVFSIDTAKAQGCDLENGWYGNVNLGACYYLGPLDTLPLLDWFGARDFCHNLGRSDTFLATDRAQYQNDLIRFIVSDLQGVKMWTSANDLSSEGVWEWDLGSGDYLSYTHWANVTDPAQPDNAAGNEDCMIIDCDDDCRWYDMACTDLYFPLCEYTP